MIPRALDVILMEQALSEFHGVDGMTGRGKQSSGGDQA